MCVDIAPALDIRFQLVHLELQFLFLDLQEVVAAFDGHFQGADKDTIQGSRRENGSL